MIIFLGSQVVTDLDGNFILQVGSSGEEGFLDGTFDKASFRRPQVRIAINIISLL